STRGEAAITAFRQAAQLDPGGSLAPQALVNALIRRGRFAEGRTAAQRALDLIPDSEPRRQALQQALESCERLLALDARLPALLQGKEQPGEAERLELARQCRGFGRPHAAARLSARAFAAPPALADALAPGHRHAAACAAARAADGSGGAVLDEPVRAELRRQALDWLRADLAVQTRLLRG